MANRFLSNIRINDAYTFPASDGTNNQVIKTDGSGNLSFGQLAADSASVMYKDTFTGDGSTSVFSLANALNDEVQSNVYIDGVYQSKSTYSVSGTTITFSTAPLSGHEIEVISTTGINSGPTAIYTDTFTANGSATAFTLGQTVHSENQTIVFLNGVYQFKGTYTLSGTTLTLDTAPANGVSIEVMSIGSAYSGGDILYDHDFTSAGLMTSDGSGVYSITANNSANWNTAYGWGDHSTQSYATQSYVGTQISNLVDSSPATLNTLNELAAALGDDPNFATTTANSIGLKAPLASPSFTGNSTFAENVTIGDNKSIISNGSVRIDIDNDNNSTTRAFVVRNNGGANTLFRVQEDGYIGIGEDSPQENLHITATTPVFRLEGGSHSYQQYVSGTSFYIRDVTNSSNRIILDSSGNVGIGTISPLTTLHVNKSSDAQVLVQGANKMALHQDAAWNSNILLGCYYDGSNIVYGTTNRGAFKIVGLHDSTTQPQTLSIYGANGASPAGSTVTFNSVGFSQDEDGNVGIGTTSPASKFEVYGGNSGVNDVDRYIRFKASNGEKRFDFYVGGTGNASSLGMYTSDGTTKNVQIASGGTSYFNGGNVGIGVTSPTAKLDVFRTINITSDNDTGYVNSALILNSTESNSRGAGVFMHNTNDDQEWYTGVPYAANFDKWMIAHKSTASHTDTTSEQANALLTVLSGGNVGIGTTSPSELLHLNKATGDPRIKLETGGGGDPGIIFQSANNRTGEMYFQDGSTSARFSYNHSNESFNLYAHNQTSIDFHLSETTTYFPTQNVGIGTTSPSRKLVVAQSNVTEPSGVDANTGILIKNNTWSGIQIISTEATGGFITFGDNAAGFAGRIQYLHATNDMVFETAASERMRINSSGNVAISGNGIQIDRPDVAGGKPYVFWKSGGTTQASIYGASSGGGLRIFLSGGIADFDNNIKASGVYLGGSGSANLLDDYEEGTFTPRLQAASGSQVSHTNQNGYYTKVGNLVTVSGTIRWNNNGSNANTTTKIEGLPFVAANVTNGRHAGSLGAMNGIAQGDTLRLVLDPGHAGAYIIQQNSNNYSHNNSISNSGDIYGFNITYKTS